MSLLLLLLFIGFVVYLLWPIIRVLFAVRQATKQSRQYFGRQQSHGQGGQRSGHDAYKPRRHRKIIDPSVGEYVDFQEIHTYTATSTETVSSDGTKTQYKAENQIEDVTWVDLPSGDKGDVK